MENNGCVEWSNRYKDGKCESVQHASKKAPQKREVYMIFLVKEIKLCIGVCVCVCSTSDLHVMYTYVCLCACCCVVECMYSDLPVAGWCRVQ